MRNATPLSLTILFSDRCPAHQHYKAERSAVPQMPSSLLLPAPSLSAAAAAAAGRRAEVAAAAPAATATHAVPGDQAQLAAVFQEDIARGLLRVDAHAICRARREAAACALLALCRLTFPCRVMQHAAHPPFVMMALV